MIILGQIESLSHLNTAKFVDVNCKQWEEALLKIEMEEKKQHPHLIFPTRTFSTQLRRDIHSKKKTQLGGDNLVF